MAITVCSSSNTSPTLPTVSLSPLPSKSSSLKPHHQFHPNTNKLTLNLSSDDHVTVSKTAAANAVAFSVAEAQAAGDAFASAYETAARSFIDRWRNGSFLRRKKRRKRRKEQAGFEFSGNEITDFVEKMPHLPFMASKSCSTKTYLTNKEVAEYVLLIQEEARLESTRERILKTNKHEPSSKEWAEAAGIKRIQLDKILCGGRESRRRINKSYRSLVVSIASRYKGRGLSIEDLIQEGSIGLIRGAKKFDPKRGNKFTTYVYWWIRQAITKAMAYNSRLIRLPASICEKLPRIAEAKANLTMQLLRPPSDEEVAEAVNMDVRLISLISERLKAPMSLDQSVTTDGHLTLQDIISGPEELTPEEMEMKVHMKQGIQKLLGLLNEREAYIMRLRYGLNGNTPRTYHDIGGKLGLSRERVRQINNDALSKLQKSSIVDNLKLYI